MKQNELKSALIGFFLTVSLMASAIGYPKYPTQIPLPGEKYVFCNLAVPTGYMSRTSWDGAYYFLGATDSKYATHAFTVQQDEDGRWFFITDVQEIQDDEDEEPYQIFSYMGYPSGTDNLNGNLATEAYFSLESGKADGFYMIKAGEGHGNANTEGVYLHLNKGGQYFVASEPTNGWYPDFYGDILYEEDGITPLFYEDEFGVEWKYPADSTSFNWAFVNVEDVPAFVMAGNAYVFLKNFEQTYCSLDDYSAGFQATLTAVTPTYQTTSFTEEAYNALRAQVQAKIDLYNQILKAEELDAEALSKAIANAKSDFNTLTDTEAVSNALATITKAINDYSLGLGDITSMGQNMSFEDLSMQNGYETSGVMPAPKGWTVYVNGEEMPEGSTNLVGSFNWHGVNSDCTGYKDGNVGFGIWAASIPNYEISQTITGLDNGTYTITAGLMLDYRRTTQRIFGNLNSTLFSYEGSYAEGILPGELKGYAEQTECGDERTMAPVTVRAYVYDGTLTFGVRTDGDFEAAMRTSGAGGDGWFKVDNFTISKDGFIEDDQISLYNYLSQTLSDLANRPMDKNYAHMFDTDYDNLDEGIAAIAGLIPVAEAQAKAYEILEAAIEKAYENATSCEEAGYAGAGAFMDFIDEVEGKFGDGEYTAEEIEGVVASLEDAYQECLRSGVSEGADVSDLIKNRSFENLTAQGNVNSNGVANPPYDWELRINGVLCETAEDIQAQGVTGWCAINSGDNISVTDENDEYWDHQYTEGTHLFGIWNGSIPEIELAQTITGLRPGTYTLTADVMVRNTDWSGVNLTTQRIFAQDVICLYGMEGYDYLPDMLEGTSSNDVYEAYMKQQNGILLDEENEYEFINYGEWDAYSNDVLLRTLSLHFGVGEAGTARIGFRTDNLDGLTGEPRTQTAAGWFKVDNFTLYYESSQLPTGIDTIDSDRQMSGRQSNGKCFDLVGRQVKNAKQHGVYIKNGKKIVK